MSWSWVWCNHDDWLQQEVIRSLVKRYVAAMIRSAKTDEGLTEENFKVGIISLVTACVWGQIYKLFQ